MKPTGFLVLLFLVGCATEPTPATDPSAAIQTLLDTQAAAWNRGDLDAFMDGYERSDALLFTSSSKIQRGFDNTLARYKSAYQDAGAMGHLAFELLDVRPLGTDAAVVLGRWTLTETPKAGGGLFSLVLVRSPQGWRIVHDHTSKAEAPRDTP